MAMIAVASLLAAVLVHRYLPRGIRPPALSLRAWRKVLQSPLLMMVVAVTLCQSAGQFTVLAYAAPHYKTVYDASPEQISLMFGYLARWRWRATWCSTG
jgi:predicted MFS family arabinose efflux permease